MPRCSTFFVPHARSQDCTQSKYLVQLALYENRIRVLKIDSLFYLCSLVPFDWILGTKETNFSFIILSFLCFFVPVCVVSSPSLIVLKKNPEVKRRINFKRPKWNLIGQNKTWSCCLDNTQYILSWQIPDFFCLIWGRGGGRKSSFLTCQA